MQSWRDFVFKLVVNLCDERGKRTFTLQEFLDVNRSAVRRFHPSNRNPFAKVRQQLQVLRDEGFLSFVDGRGTYTLRGKELLKDEVEDERVAEIRSQTPARREYLIETYARNRGWVKEAKDKFGSLCMYPECKNTFPKPDGEPYIEVHHVVPLFEGGEDAIWNLAVVCAHHHKMAHFADPDTCVFVSKLLQREVARRL